MILDCEGFAGLEDEFNVCVFPLWWESSIHLMFNHACEQIFEGDWVNVLQNSGPCQEWCFLFDCVWNITIAKAVQHM